MPACTDSILHNESMTEKSKALSITAFATLLLVAFMMGANHVAARFAFNHGVDVITAVKCCDSFGGGFDSVATESANSTCTATQKILASYRSDHCCAKCLFVFIGGQIARGLGLVGFQYLPLVHRILGARALQTPTRKSCALEHAVYFGGLGFGAGCDGRCLWFGSV